MASAFPTQFVAYTPGGAQLTSPTYLVPTLEAKITVPYNEFPTLEIPVSTVLYGTIPKYLEVGVEYWNGASWNEIKGCRFLMNGRGNDDTDPAGVQTLTGINMWGWFLSKTYLGGVDPYFRNGLDSVGSLAITGATSAGVTITKNGHGFSTGDRVRIDAAGGMNEVSVGSTYFVRNVTANTFQLAGSAGGVARKVAKGAGIAMHLRRHVVKAEAHHFLLHQKVTVMHTGGADNLSAGQDYYIVEPTTNGFSLASTVGGTPIDIDTVNGMDIKLALDGDRRFNNVTPGTMLKTLIQEAIARGELLNGALTYDFTEARDSDGKLWPKYTIGVPPNKTGTQFFQMLLDLGWIEFATDGRALHAYGAGHGYDRSVGDTPVQLGKNADARPLKANLDNVLTDVVSVADNGRITAVRTTPGPWPLGRLAAVQTQSGVTDTVTSSAVTDKTVSLTATPDEQYTITEAADVALYLPFRSYQPGDTVMTRLSAKWTPLNVASINLRVDGDLNTTIDVILGRRFRGILSKVNAKVNKFIAGVGDLGSSTPAPSIDQSRPAAPANVVYETTGAWIGANPKADINATWDAVVLDESGSPITVVDYEMFVRSEDSDVPVSAGRTGGLLFHKAPGYDPDNYHYISVRARSANGIWGAPSEEEELVTSTPVIPLDPPSAPALTVKLGVVKATWDGTLASPLDGVIAPPAQFAYVYAAVSDTPTGLYTPAGASISHSGGITITGLIRGNTYYVQFYAVDSLGVTSQPSASTPIVVVGVVGPDIEANSITANEIAVGVLEAEFITLGAQVPQGGPTERVPTPPTNMGWWSGVIAGTTPLTVIPGFTGYSLHAAASPLGVVLSPTSSEQAYLYFTAVLAVPQSRSIYSEYLISGSASGGAGVTVVTFDGAGAASAWRLNHAEAFAFPSNAVTYTVYVSQGAGGGGRTVSALRIFEAVGTAVTGQQNTQITPAGLIITNDDGSAQAAFTTNTDNYLTISQKQSDGSYQDKTVLDNQGGASFQSLSVATDVTVRGTDLLGGFEGITRNGSSDGGAVFDRLARGGVAAAFFAKAGGTYTDATRAIAVGKFVATVGRRYEFKIDSSFQAYNSAGVGTSVIEVLVSQTPIGLNDTSGYSIVKRAQFNSTVGIQINPLDMSRGMRVRDAVSSIQFAGGDNYILVRLTNSGGSNLVWGNIVPIVSIMIDDVGPDVPNIPDWSVDGTTGTPTPPGVATTQAWTAAWSRSWANNGTTVEGNPYLTQGPTNLVGPQHTAKFGFPPLGLSGRTITACQVMLRNVTTTLNAGARAVIGTHGDTSAPATFTGTPANEFDQDFARGEGRWVSVPEYLWPSIASGSIRGFSLGSAAGGVLGAKFAGVSVGSPPQLRVTYY
ncbi:hypothetical protein [Glaciihabitans sp. dw_435]|uniref:hypothetical protein n=1 Tax=Glaciihabitans sp. dw_435 TaxID=2720081 RepID=UPI001BD4CAE3|nr:hypothetical protein [Glaciihabitans sp. dw_435]